MSIFTKRLCGTVMGLAALAGLALLLSTAATGQDPSKSPTAKEKGTTPLPQRPTPAPDLSIPIPGTSVPVYPNNFLKPFESTILRYQMPTTITKVEYDSARRKLRVGLSFTLPEASEERFKERVVNLFHTEGKPQVESKHLFLTPMRPSKVEVWLTYKKERYLLAESFDADRQVIEAMTPEFDLPMQPGMEALHEALCNHQESVNVNVRSFYPFESLAVVSVRANVMHGVYRKLMEKVVGPRGTTPDVVLIKRSDIKNLREVLTSQIDLVVESYGYSREERDALVREMKTLALANLDKLPPIDLVTLHENFDKYFIYNVETGRLETMPDKIQNVITMSESAHKMLRETDELAESISDLSSNRKLETHDVHSAVRKLAVGHKGSVEFVAKIGSDWHLESDFSSLDDTKREQVEAARTFASNKTHFKKKAYDEAYAKLLGDLREEKTLPKSLDLVVLSSAILAGVSKSDITDAMAVESHLLSLNTTVPLKAYPPETRPTDKVIAALVARIQELEQKMPATEKLIVAQHERIQELEKQMPAFDQGFFTTKENFSSRGAGATAAEKIEFKTVFSAPPKVIVTITYIDAHADTGRDMRVLVEPGEITAKGFTLNYGSASGSMLSSVRVTWTAIGQK